ncbi:hypothetical protein [Lishizhenia sp.]|uniref:hypothetical protein n=1 Tax=Lishizhenia sp. TaxID=2497594 RepID=UPI00299E8B6C|nr:hypothetical protein [Lishizhenia sp.]MDX1446499.1 hypothetical protein [Lishizhenia sp.]
MKNTTLVLCALFAFLKSYGQEEFNPKNSNHEILIYTESTFPKKSNFDFTYDEKYSTKLFLSLKSDRGIGVNYKRKVIDKGNFFMHIGLNTGKQTFNYNLVHHSGYAHFQEFTLNRHKLKVGFSKEWYLLKNKLLIEPVFQLSYLTTFNKFNSHTANYFNEKTGDFYETDVKLYSTFIRKFYPQLQLNISYALTKQLYLGVFYQTKFIQDLPYNYSYQETLISEDPNLSDQITFDKGSMLMLIQRRFIGVSLSFKY